jgi:hypothetical protein
MYRKLCIIFAVLFLLGLCSFLEAQVVDYSTIPRSVRLPWPRDDKAWSYEVIIEREIGGTYREHLQEFTQEFFVIVSLLPGKYRYRVIPFDYLGRPETELSSAWRNFEIPALVPPQANDPNLSPRPDVPILLPEFDNPIVPAESDDPIAQSDDPAMQSDDSTAQGESEEPITDSPGDKRRAARLSTRGISVGTSLYRPWVIATVHATIAPLPYSFLEAGIDLGLISGDADGRYYSLYPFAHYALFAPFPGTAGRQSGGWYIGAGGGYWMSTYILQQEEYTATDTLFPGEGEVTENKFVADFITGFNFFNMFDVSYTLRTDFKGISHKVSVGVVYRFK